MGLTPYQENWLLRTLGAVNFVHILDFMILMPLAPYLIAAFDINAGTFSLLVAVYAISAALCGIAIGGVIDRFHRRRLFFTVFGLFTLATLACALAPSFGFLLLARAAAGAAGGLLGAMVKTLVADAVPPPRRGLAMGKVMMGFAAASVFGVPLGLFMAAHAPEISWRAAFLFVVLCAVVVFILARRFLPDLPQRARHPHSALRQFWLILSEPSHRYAFLFSSAVVLGAFTVIPYIALYMTTNIGIDAAHLSYIYLFGGIASLMVSMAIGRLADIFGVRRVFAIGALVSIIPVWVLTHLPVVPLWVALVATTSFFIAMSGRMVPSQTLLSLVPKNELRAGFMSVQSSVEQISMGVASLLAGLLIHQDSAGHLEDYPRVGYVAIGFIVVAIYLAYKCVLLNDRKHEPKAS